MVCSEPLIPRFLTGAQEILRDFDAVEDTVLSRDLRACVQVVALYPHLSGSGLESLLLCLLLTQLGKRALTADHCHLVRLSHPHRLRHHLRLRNWLSVHRLDVRRLVLRNGIVRRVVGWLRHRDGHSSSRVGLVHIDTVLLVLLRWRNI